MPYVKGKINLSGQINLIVKLALRKTPQQCVKMLHYFFLIDLAGQVVQGICHR